MRQLLSTDWHLGVRGDSSVFHDIFVKWIDSFLIPQIKSNEVAELVILGDLFDSRNEVNVKTENIALENIEKVITSAPKLNIKILVGNHDCYFKNRRDVNSLKKFKKFDRVEVIEEITLRKVGKQELLYCPWLIEKSELTKYIKENGPKDLLYSHLDINGFQLTRGVVEKSAWQQSFFKENFKKTFSGHFHLRDEQGNILYIGSPFQMDWGDYSNPKGIYIFDTETLQTKFIENTISPVFVKLYLSQIIKDNFDQEKVAGNFVQLILDEKLNEKELNKLNERILNSNPLTFKVDGDNERVELNIEEIQDSISSPIDYLVKYIKEIEVREDIDKDKLIKLAYKLHQSGLQ